MAPVSWFDHPWLYTLICHHSSVGFQWVLSNTFNIHALPLCYKNIQCASVTHDPLWHTVPSYFRTILPWLVQTWQNLSVNFSQIRDLINEIHKLCQLFPPLTAVTGIHFVIKKLKPWLNFISVHLLLNTRQLFEMHVLMVHEHRGCRSGVLWAGPVSDVFHMKSNGSTRVAAIWTPIRGLSKGWRLTDPP